MPKLIIENIEIEVTKKKIKNIHLSVHPPYGIVKVSAPINMKDEAIRFFVISKLEWIKKKRLKFTNQETIPEIHYISGESHYYFGTSYILNVIYITKNPAKVEIENNQYINLYVKEDTTTEQREKIVKEWYREKLKKHIPLLIDKWEGIMGVKVNSWGVKLMKTRWGTCNIRDKRIWINLELVKKPPHCLEYIIVHEMAHLLERGHGERFKALMDLYYSNWRSVKAELNSRIFE